MISGQGIRRFSTWGRAFAVFVLPLVVVATANAQWTVVHLHPAGATASYAYDVSGGQQVGEAVVGSSTRASLWSGTAASWTDLTPAGATESWAYGVGGGQQVGMAWMSGLRAGLWSGTAASWTDLTPAGATESRAYGVGGGQQVGEAYGGSTTGASLWSGTAASWVNLQPSWARTSVAYGTNGGKQVGFAGVPQSPTSEAPHACLWSGTAASSVDLHPDGAWMSYAYGVRGGSQVGVAGVDGHYYASLWTGSASSWVNLNPTGVWSSGAYGVSDSQQVGYVIAGGGYRASLWSGTAASWVDLHAFLPSNYSESEARGIWSDGLRTYVVGYGYNTTTSRNEALMWVSSPSGISSLEFVPNAIAPTGSSQARAITWGNVTKVTLRADPNQNLPITEIKMVRSGDTWTASISGLSLTNRNRNPVQFTATATTTDSGSPTASASLSIVDPGAFVGMKADTGQTVRGIVCDNPADFDNRAPTEPAILAVADKLELVLPSGMTAQSDQGSVCLNGNGTSVDRNGDPNAGSIIVSGGKVYYLPPDEFNETQRPTSVGDVTVRPLRPVTVRATIKLTDNRVIAFNTMYVTLARPVVVLIHGINKGPHDTWDKFVAGENGQYVYGHRVPYVTVNHFDRLEGNDMVELAAIRLRDRISDVKRLLVSGSFMGEIFSSANGGVYRFFDYRGHRLACKRVDIVAHSYGGVIARWYLASDGAVDSYDWYDLNIFETSLIFQTPVTYGQDVRKLITLGSMWRGVPLANYANEVNSGRIGDNGRRFRDADTIANPNGTNNLGGWVDGIASGINFYAGRHHVVYRLRTKVASMAVMAVESPWLQRLLGRDPSNHHDPFQEDVAYGSVAGDKEIYIYPEGIYGFMNFIQKPSWFSTINREWRNTFATGDPGWNDGLVPVWSAAIPGSAHFVTVNHTDLPGDPDARAYVLQGLNRSSLPLARDLNPRWTTDPAISDPLSGGSWNFATGAMGPIGWSDAFQLSDAPIRTAQLNPGWWGPGR